MEFTARLSPIGGPMIQYVIEVPEYVASVFKKDKGAVRILCSVNGAEEFPCALNPRNGSYVIMASKQLIKKHRLQEATPFRVLIRTDIHDGLKMPEEFLEVLDQDDRANLLFDALLPGRKRSLLYYIRSAKSVDTRIKRSFEIAEKLKTESLHFQKPE